MTVYGEQVPSASGLARISAVAERWLLTLGDPLVGGTSSVVYGCRDRSGRDLVLKLPTGRADPASVTAAEAAALTAWVDTGAVPRLVDPIGTRSC